MKCDPKIQRTGERVLRNTAARIEALGQRTAASLRALREQLANTPTAEEVRQLKSAAPAQPPALPQPSALNPQPLE